MNARERAKAMRRLDHLDLDIAILSAGLVRAKADGIGANEVRKQRCKLAALKVRRKATLALFPEIKHAGG
jgi:hypothetical protein